MSIKNVIAFASIFALSIIMLIIYPSTDKSVNAGQSKSFQDMTALSNAHQISVSSDAVIAHYFGNDVVDKIMKQPGCVKVRTYYGKHTNGRSGFICVGVDKDGKDMTPVVIAGPTGTCPPYCGF